jgi:hypothetical protein
MPDFDIVELLKDSKNWDLITINNGFLDSDMDNEDNRVTIKEAMSTPDAPILFPKAISNIMKEAAEPLYLVTPLLSLVRLSKVRSMEFPAVNAIQAAEVPEGGEFPEQQLVFAKQAEGKVSKKGVKIAFTEEVIEDSQWDIFGMHVRAAARAMARLKEQIALARFTDAATTCFDNSDPLFPDTTGLDINGSANYSLALDDIIDMFAAIMAENHVATDIIMHPLAWAIFAKDPIIRSANVYGNAGAWASDSLKGSRGEYGRYAGPMGAVSSAVPFGLNVILSPFVNFTPKVTGGTPSPATTDVFVIDRNECGVLMVRDDMSTDEWNDLTRDVRYLKLKERYDIVILGDGEGIQVARDVYMVKNYDTGQSFLP